MDKISPLPTTTKDGNALHYWGLFIINSTFPLDIKRTGTVHFGGIICRLCLIHNQYHHNQSYGKCGAQNGYHTQQRLITQLKKACCIIFSFTLKFISSFYLYIFLFLMQRFGRLNLHSLCSRHPNAKTIISAINNQVTLIPATNRNVLHSTGHTAINGLLPTEGSINATFRHTIVAGIATTVNKISPSPSSNRLTCLRQLPTLMRKAISLRRRRVRYQNVPTTPIKTFTNRKAPQKNGSANGHGCHLLIHGSPQSFHRAPDSSPLHYPPQWQELFLSKISRKVTSVCFGKHTYRHRKRHIYRSNEIVINTFDKPTL